MLVNYMPEDGDHQSWEFDPRRVRASEAVMIQKRFGGTWEEFRAAVLQGDVEARRVLLWHLIRRTHHTLRFEDTPDFYTAELIVQATRTELLEMRAALVSNRGVPDDQREIMLSAIDVEIERAPDPEAGQGKASSPISSNDTGSPSPS